MLPIEFELDKISILFSDQLRRLPLIERKRRN